jgi:hypothetical protein
LVMRAQLRRQKARHTEYRGEVVQSFAGVYR